MHIGSFTSDSYTYFMNNQPLPTVDLENDLGVVIDNQLKFHHHTGATIAKANCVLAIINKSFANLDVTMLPILYKALVQPILEYANAIWGPFFVTDQIAIEKVQKCATKMISTIKNLPYNKRLIILKLPSLSQEKTKTGYHKSL